VCAPGFEMLRLGSVEVATGGTAMLKLALAVTLVQEKACSVGSGRECIVVDLPLNCVKAWVRGWGLRCSVVGENLLSSRSVLQLPRLSVMELGVVVEEELVWALVAESPVKCC
jgi:hypothetical protein